MLELNNCILFKPYKSSLIAVTGGHSPSTQTETKTCLDVSFEMCS